jgi:hypothetical protein
VKGVRKEFLIVKPVVANLNFTLGHAPRHTEGRYRYCLNKEFA